VQLALPEVFAHHRPQIARFFANYPGGKYQTLGTANSTR